MGHFNPDQLRQFSQLKTSTTIGPDILECLKEHGIHRHTPRGLRAGTRMQRPIKVRITSHKHQHKSAVAGSRPNNLAYLKRAIDLQPTSNVHARMGLFNARSVANKCGEISELVLDRDFNLLAITETWLREGDDPIVNHMCPPGYNFVGFPREKGRGGGLGLLYKSTLDIEVINKASYDTFESMCIKVKLAKPVLLCVVYRPPPSHKNQLTASGFIDEIEQFLSSLVTDVTEDLCILGDFNMHIDNSDDTVAKRFLRILSTLDLQQHLTTPTHRAGHILDLIITRSGSDVVGHVDVCDTHLSDHYLLNFSLQQELVHQPRKLLARRSFKTVDKEALAHDIVSALHDCGQVNTIHDLASHYNQAVTTVLDHHAPPRTICLKGEGYKKWYDIEVHDARKQRRLLERQYAKSGLTVHKQMVKGQCIAVARLIDRKKSEYYKGRFLEADTRETFRLVSGLICVKGQRILPSHFDKESLANSFANFFDQKVAKIQTTIDACSVNISVVNEKQDITTSVELASFQPQTTGTIMKIIRKCPPKSCSLDPLPTTLLKDEAVLPQIAPVITDIINRSLESGVVPDNFKIAQVAPLIKKPGLDPNVLQNYRPVSNLPFVNKVLEKIVAQQLTQHLKQHRLYDPLQSAYKKGHSTETALLKIKADMDKILDDGDGVLLVMLDLSAAFDTLDHKILFRRLEETVGIKGAALEWLKSYLNNRYQRVHIDDAYSSNVALTTGVPQGSVLGPLLFVIYILPLKCIIDKHAIHRHAYADDGQLYQRLHLRDPTQIAEDVTKMERCLVDVRSWMIHNRLMLNDCKTEVLCVVRGNQKKLVEHIKVKIGGSFIASSTCVRNLGGNFDKELTMENQVQSVVRSANYHLRRISKIRSLLDETTCAKVVNNTITCRLDYHNGLLSGLHDKHIKSLQLVQNNAARLLTGTRKYNHIRPTLCHLHWLPVKQRISFKVLVTIHKALHDEESPDYLREMFTLYKPARSLRSSADPWKLTVPKHNQYYGRRSLQVYGATSWNDLPMNLRELTSVQSFKKKLKTVLFRTAYEL